jgi:chromosome segregation ATPase
MTQTQQHEFNESITTLTKQIAQLSQRLQDIENKTRTLDNAVQIFSKLGQHAASCEPNAVKNEIKSLKADMLELAKQVKTIHEALSTGSIANRPKVTFSKEDYASVLPARLKEASLAEIIALTTNGGTSATGV